MGVTDLGIFLFLFFFLSKHFIQKQRFKEDQKNPPKIQKTVKEKYINCENENEQPERLRGVP